ncbi:MAG TPA: GAF domain-containing protein [Burkholderiaceae bacterium]|nr:GAF domain-containing protein [Burkholderiaceae bacterium]
MHTDWPEHSLQLPSRIGRRAIDAGILADITAGLAAGNDLHDLLQRFLKPVMQVAGARAGAVRVLSAEGDRLQMVSEVGLPEHVVCAERSVDPACGICGSAFTRDTVVWASDVGHCARRSADSYFGDECRHLLAVPLTHRGRVLGLYNLFFDARPVLEAEATALLQTIGELLGLALHHASLERENLRATVLQERHAMAAEVHDSIAQTLAFVKMRMPLMQEAIARHDEAAALGYCADVRKAVSSAHSNLREVLAHFRAPMDPLGLRNALRSSILAFRELTGVDLAFDEPVPELRLSAAQEFQLLRIVQEALANIAKHARAHRAWLTIEQRRDRIVVVIDDDGDGLPAADAAGDGPHYGLDIMRERAASLQGSLDVLPRDGGGTRVRLEFPVQAMVDVSR